MCSGGAWTVEALLVQASTAHLYARVNEEIQHIVGRDVR